MKDNKNGKFGKAVGIGLASILCLGAVTVAPIKKAVDTGKADKKQIESQATKIADLEKENDIFEADKNSLLEANRELSNKNNTLTEKNQELTEKNSALENDKQDLANKNSQLTQDKENLTNANNQLAQEKENLTNANNQLAQDKENLTNANNQLTQDKENLTNANNQLTQDKQDLTNTNNQLMQDKENLTNANNQLTQDKENLTNANNQLTQDKATLEQEKQTLQAQLDAAPTVVITRETNLDSYFMRDGKSIQSFIDTFKTSFAYVDIYESGTVTVNGVTYSFRKPAVDYALADDVNLVFKFFDKDQNEVVLTSEQLNVARNDASAPQGLSFKTIDVTIADDKITSLSIGITINSTVVTNGYGLASINGKTFTYNDSMYSATLSNPTVISDNNTLGITTIESIKGLYAFDAVTLNLAGKTLSGRFVYNVDTDELAFLKLWKEEMVGTVYTKYNCNRNSEKSFALLDPDTGSIIDTFHISNGGGWDTDELPEDPGDI